MSITRYQSKDSLLQPLRRKPIPRSSAQLNKLDLLWTNGRTNQRMDGTFLFFLAKTSLSLRFRTKTRPSLNEPKRSSPILLHARVHIYIYIYKPLQNTLGVLGNYRSATSTNGWASKNTHTLVHKGKPVVFHECSCLRSSLPPSSSPTASKSRGHISLWRRYGNCVYWWRIENRYSFAAAFALSSSPATILFVSSVFPFLNLSRSPPLPQQRFFSTHRASIHKNANKHTIEGVLEI